LGLENRTVLITGAASGIGLAAVNLFMRHGARVIAFDMDEQGLEALRAARKDEALATICGDVSKTADWIRALALAEHDFGGLDALFNNAGITGPRASILSYPEAEFDRVMAVNVRGVFLGIQHAGLAMKARGKGAIVNTSSIVGFTGGRNIRVNAVCPSPTATEMMFKLERELAPDNPSSIRAAFAANSPMNRYGEPEEVAEAALWLCCDAASYITGVSLPIDGGMVAR
jgi:NAD(P)-dependent dehydrogenase (short-subunit alcohol dehydrogenase family)